MGGLQLFPFSAARSLARGKGWNQAFLYVQRKRCFEERAGQGFETDQPTKSPLFSPMKAKNTIVSNQSRPSYISSVKYP
jgi:hypothetical protein